jgi:ABC-type branched-subunit amino acid transport system ATPase component
MNPVRREATMGALIDRTYESRHSRQTTPITLLLGEQNMKFALLQADRAYVLDRGRVT